MATVNLDVASTTLTQLLPRVEAGEEILLERNGRPVAKLIPYQPSLAGRRFGAMRGVLSVGPEFFEPLPEIDLWA